MASILDQLRGFGSLDAGARAALEGAGSVVSVAPDTDLVRQGEAPDSLHLLVDGWACRAKLLEDGRRQSPALHLPGDACDLDGLGGVPLAYGVATLTKAQVAVWPHHALALVMTDHPSVGAAFLGLALAENAIATQGAVVLGRLSARERLAHLLCELLARLEAVGRAAPDGCPLPLTQAELADVLGITPVHVNRVLQELRGEGLIRLEHHRLTVLDLEGLRTAGQFQPDYLRTDGSLGHLESAPDAGRGPSAAEHARALEAKDAALRDAHHRTKNTIQVATSLLALQAGRSRSLEVRAALKEAMSRLDVLAGVHELLHQSGSGQQTVGLPALIGTLADGLQRSFPETSERVHLRVRVDGVSLDPDRAVPLALLVNEAVTNAYKHAFPDGRRGEIVVSLERTGDHGTGALTLTVRDNGVGLPAKGRDGSLGLKLIQSFGQQLDGELSLSGEGGGTTVALRLPLAP